MPGMWLFLAIGTMAGSSGSVESAAAVPAFDRVEINHKLDCDGNIQFVQIIAWDWSPDYCRFHCQGWRLIKRWKIDNRRSLISFLEASEKRWFHIRSTQVQQTWTRHDPEMLDRKIFPMQYRRW